MRPRRRFAFAAPLVALALVIAFALAATPALASTPSGKSLANKVLKLDPRKPADIDLFTSKLNGVGGAYPSGSAMHPASGPELTTSQVRAKLTPFLKRLSGGDNSVVNRALGLFDNAKAKSMIPDPNIRAGFAATLPTFGAPTLNHFLNDGHFTTMSFGQMFGAGGLNATSQSQPDVGGHQKIVINGRYRNEDFRLFVCLVPQKSSTTTW